MPDTAIIDAVTAGLLVFVAIIGLILNILVLLTILYNKALRTPFTTIVCFICIAHIIEFCIPLPLRVLGELHYSDTPNWPFGELVCKLMNYVFYSMTSVIGYCIVLLALDRIYTAQEKEFWKLHTSFLICGLLTLLMLAINLVVPFVYAEKDEYLTAKKTIQICSLAYFNHVVLACFFVFSFLIPLILTILFVFLLSISLKARKQYQLGDSVAKEFLYKTGIVVFALGFYALFRLLWHVDRLLISAGIHYDFAHLVTQNFSDILWYLNAVFFAGYVLYAYPNFKEGVKAMCCRKEPIEDVEEYEDELILMPVVTTEADPKRYDTWPRGQGYGKLSGSMSSISSRGTTIASNVEEPNWRIVRTLERPTRGSNNDITIEPIAVQIPLQSERNEEKIKVSRDRIFRKRKPKLDKTLLDHSSDTSSVSKN